MKKLWLLVLLIISVNLFAGSAKDFVQNYPKQAEFLIDSIDWKLPELQKLKDKDSAVTCQNLVDYFKKTKKMTSKTKLKPKKNGSSANAVIAMVEEDKLENGAIDFTRQRPIPPLYRWGFLNNIVATYAGTKDEKYNQWMKKLFSDFLLYHPVPTTKNLIGNSLWDTLHCSIRTNEIITALSLYRGVEGADDELILLMLTAIPLQCEYNHALGAKGEGNYTTSENSNQVSVINEFPEFRRGKEWFKESVKVFLECVDTSILPDGAQAELSLLYGYLTFFALDNFYTNLSQNGHTLPKNFMDLMKQQLIYYTWLTAPNGNLASLGDTNGNSNGIQWNDNRGSKYAEKYDVPEVKYILSDGKIGEKPTTPPSRMFDYSGYAVSRDSYLGNGQWSVFDMGPYGIGHVHHDNLHLSVYNKRRILVDNGRWYYRKSGEPNAETLGGWESEYLKSVKGHNCVSIGNCDQFFPHWRQNSSSRDLTRDYYSKSGEPISKKMYEITEEYDFFRGITMNGFVGYNKDDQGFGQRLMGKNAHERGVYYKRGKYWVVTDRIFTDSKQSVEAFWHFHPDVKMVKMLENGSVASYDKNAGNLLIVPINGDLRMKGKLYFGSEEPKQGWFVPDNKRKVPAYAVEYKAEEDSISLGWFGWLLLPFDGDQIPEVEISGATYVYDDTYKYEFKINGNTEFVTVKMGDTPNFVVDKHFKGLIPAYLVDREYIK